MTKNEFITNYIADGNGDFAAAEKAWKVEFGGRGKTEVDELYEVMVETPMTEQGLYLWLAENGTPNTCRWASYHNRTRRAINKVHEQGGEDFQEVYASKDDKAAVKATYTN